MNITLYPLTDYNNSRLNQFTIELDNLDAEEYKQEIAQGLWYQSEGGNVLSTYCPKCEHIVIGSQLNECPECGNEESRYDEDGEENPEGLQHKDTNEEYIVCDSEDIPSRFIGEYALDPEFWDYKEFMEKTHLDPEAVEAGLECGIPLENIEDAYQGEYKSHEDFAERQAEDLGIINDELTWPHNCIDWTRAARDLMMDYNEENGYYFSRNY